MLIINSQNKFKRTIKNSLHQLIRYFRIIKYKNKFNVNNCKIKSKTNDFIFFLRLIASKLNIYKYHVCIPVLINALLFIVNIYKFYN